MEDDRYQKNHKLYIIGMLAMVMSLALFAFCLYMLPNLLFGWQYNTPEFIMFWKERLAFQYGLIEAVASKIILFVLFLLSLIFVVIAYFSSNRIESQIFSTEPKGTKKSVKLKMKSREGMNLTLKILFIIIIVFVVASLLEWVIYNTSSQ